MSKAYVFMANGSEEVEALMVVDILRRAKVDVDIVSVTGENVVVGSHNIRVIADKLVEDIEDNADLIVLPGGIPGTYNLRDNQRLSEIVTEQYKSGRYVSAICAAPTILGGLGILEGRHACCYPGYEEELNCYETCMDAVVVDDNVITSRGLGTAADFGLALVSLLTDEETAEALSNKIIHTV